VVPSAVFIAEDGEIHVGENAELRAWQNPARFYSLFKPNLLSKTDESFAGGPTPVELTAHLIKYIIGQLLVKMPELADYPQFGGNLRLALELEICFTIPAGWGIEQQGAMKRAILLAGMKVEMAPVRFKTEPGAGCRRIAHEHERRLKDGDRTACFDIGGGTTDVIVVRHERGTWHEDSPPLGDQCLGGRNFTAALARLITEKLSIDCKNAFTTEDGLRIDAVASTAEREVVLNIWQAAEQLKLRLATVERAAAFVQTPGGKREVQVEISEAQKVWSPLWQRIEHVITSALSEWKVNVSEIPHVFLIGGSSLLPGLVELVARLTKRNPSDVLVSEDSTHVVSNGAAEEAFYREDADQVLTGGIGLRLLDDVGGIVNRVYLRPNQIIPAGGMVVEALGQCVRSPGGKGKLRLVPFVAKPGVRCSDPLVGVEVFLDDKEIVPLHELATDIDLPPGQHDIRVGISIDAFRNTNLAFTPLGFPNHEPSVVSLALQESGASQHLPVRSEIDIAMILDCSKSMAGEKLVQAKRATERFVRDVVRYFAKVSLIRMGGEDKAAVEVPLSDDVNIIVDALQRLTAFGGTHMTESISLAKDVLKSGLPDNHKIAVVFSDGMPQNLASAVAAADELKQFARVVCVGIGADAQRQHLERIASSREDYFEAETPNDILECLYRIAELVQATAGGNETYTVTSA